MGAFMLYPKTSSLHEDRVLSLYNKKFFSNPSIFNIGDYKLMLFTKNVVKAQNYLIEDEFYIFTIGSLFYRGLGFGESLKSLLSDYKKNAIDEGKIYGNYVIIFFNHDSKRIDLFIDPAFIKSVYFDKEKKHLSTDFLALLSARNSNYSINKLAIVENLITGHLISPDTYVNEIEKIDKINFNILDNYFSGICFKAFKPNISNSVQSRDSAINHANNLLNTYFDSGSAISNEYGAHIGLTGGFDSRLLLMHARKQIKNLNTNSFWRPNSLEYQNAKELALVSGLDFFSFEKQPFKIPEKDEMKNELMFVFDGQIRSQNRWDEEFALSDYTTRISNKHYVGFHGCGGEQYRNAERFSGKMSLQFFILNEWMFKQCTNPFIGRDALKWELYKNIKKKFYRLLGNFGNRIGLFEIKRIQNEIWNTANRATRVNVLNQQQFYFAPFTEFIISQNAYKYIPFLGHSLSFQIEMMRTFDVHLSSVNTNYGFNLIEGEPVKNHMIALLLKLIPRKWVLQFYQKINENDVMQNNSDQFIRQAHPILQDLQRSINYSVLIQNPNLSSGLFSFDFLLKTLIKG